MPEYRLHFLAGGRVGRTAIIAATDDDEAMRLAARHDAHSVIELLVR